MTKRKPKSEHKKNGRPTVVTPDVLAKLEQGFSMGFTDDEACLFVGISVDALYKHIKRNPKFGPQKELLKKSPLIRAKRNVAKALAEEDRDMTKWYLERKAKAEFSTRNEVLLDVGNAVMDIVPKHELST